MVASQNNLVCGGINGQRVQVASARISAATRGYHEGSHIFNSDTERRPYMLCAADYARNALIRRNEL
jgi:hypothetical protein